MKSVVLAIAVAFVPSIALADTFEFTLKNTYVEAVASVSVSGGKVEGFKRVPSSASRSFNVTLPDGECSATMTVNFEDGNSVESEDFDFCQYNMFEVTFEY